MSDQGPATGATPTPVYIPDAGATPSREATGGATPPETPSRTGATPTETTAPADGRSRDGEPGADRDEAQHDAALSVDDMRAALAASRQAERKAARELKRFQDADKARADAEKSDLERAVERAEAAEARASALERQTQAQAIAVEFQIPQWADELAGDADTRTMKEHARRIRERLTPESPGMEGGVRGLGVSAQPVGMDDLIRGAGRR